MAGRVVKVLQGALLVFVGLAALYGVGRLVQVSLGSLYGGERGPYLQSLSDTGVTVRWQTLDDNTGVVRYGLEPGRLDLELRETDSDEEHELRLTGLQPDTRYYYSVGTADQVWQGGEGYWFVTAPEAGTEIPVRVWVAGDPGLPGDDADRVAAAAVEWMEDNHRPDRPLLDVWLTTGDNAYRSGTNKQYQAALFTPRAGLLRNVPIWPAYGNHDSRRWAHFDIFTLPENAESGGLPSGTEKYFSFDYGPVHFIMLDSQTSNMDPDGAMLRWLAEDLEATDQPWSIAVLHHPPYSKGTHDSDNRSDSGGRMHDVRENVLTILEAGGVDLVLTGHTHMYERSFLLDGHYGTSDTLTPAMILDDGDGDPATDGAYRKRTEGRAANEGVVYAVVGSSSKLDDGPLDHPANVVSLKQLGSLIIDVDGARLDGLFVNADGEVSDHFAIVKGVAKGSAE